MIEPIPEIIADTSRICEIRFDCTVTMFDVGYSKYKDSLGRTIESKIPQWFRSSNKISLESIKYSDPYELGVFIKQMFHELETAIKRYEDTKR